MLRLHGWLGLHKGLVLEMELQGGLVFTVGATGIVSDRVSLHGCLVIELKYRES